MARHRLCILVYNWNRFSGGGGGGGGWSTVYNLVYKHPNFLKVVVNVTIITPYNICHIDDEDTFFRQ